MDLSRIVLQSAISFSLVKDVHLLADWLGVVLVGPNYLKRLIIYKHGVAIQWLAIVVEI